MVLATAGCKEDNTVKIGVVLPLSGQAAAYGESIKRGVELAIAESTARPESPFVVSWVTHDSQGDPAKGRQLLDELYAGGAIAVLGGVTSDEAQAMVEVADQRDRVLLSPSASSPDLTGASRNFFRIFPSDFVEGTKMGQFAKQKLNLAQVVVLATQSPYGQGIQGVFANEFVRQGGEIVETLEFPAATSDVSGLIERVSTLQPGGVYIAGYWEEICTLIKGLQAAQYQGRVLTTSAFATPQAMACAGAAAEGVMFTQTVFDPTSEADSIRAFVSGFQARYGGEEPDLYAAHGYDAVHVLLTALDRSGTTVAADFGKAMLRFQGEPLQGVTGAIQFDEKGDVQRYPQVYVINEGQAANYERWQQEKFEAIRQKLRDLEERQRRLAQGS
jgi:branched-chain amino acid transport system substrate-binding protein